MARRISLAAKTFWDIFNESKSVLELERKFRLFLKNAEIPQILDAMEQVQALNDAQDEINAATGIKFVFLPQGMSQDEWTAKWARQDETQADA